MKFNVTSLFSGVQDLGTEVKNKQLQLEKLRQKKLALVSAPVNRKDALKFFHHMVDREATKYPQHLINRYRWMQTGQHATVTPEETDGHPDNDFASQILFPSRVFSSNERSPEMMSMQSAMCFFFGDQIKEKLAAAVDSMDWSGEGPPREERIKELAKLDKEIADIEGELKELNRSLNKIREAL